MSVLRFVIAVMCAFFCIDTAPTDIYTYLHTLSLHDALPIYAPGRPVPGPADAERFEGFLSAMHAAGAATPVVQRSEEHTSELQSLMRTSSAVFCLKKKKTRDADMVGRSFNCDQHRGNTDGISRLATGHHLGIRFHSCP